MTHHKTMSYIKSIFRIIACIALVLEGSTAIFGMLFAIAEFFGILEEDKE